MLPLQRHPWNPGACGAGAKWHYKYTPMQQDFYVYTMVYDMRCAACERARASLDASSRAHTIPAMSTR